MRRRVLSRIPAILFGVLLVVAIALPALGFDPREFARAHGGVTRVSIATGNTGGVYYPYGGGLARVISQQIARVQATAEVTAASVDNLKLIQRGKADIAFTLADTLRRSSRDVSWHHVRRWRGGRGQRARRRRDDEGRAGVS